MQLVNVIINEPPANLLLKVYVIQSKKARLMLFYQEVVVSLPISAWSQK